VTPTIASRKDVSIAVLVGVLFILIGLFTGDRYGLTWDEPENLVVGERYLAFFSTGDVTFLDFSDPRPSVDNPDGLHLRLLDSHVHPPLPNIAAALAGRVLGRWTGGLDPVDARHAAVVVMGGATLSVTYLFAREAFGRLVALLAALALAFSPRFVGHAHYNLKDIPKTLMFCVTLWALWRGVTFRRPGWILGAGFALGVGFSVRPNLALAAAAGALWVAVRLPHWRAVQAHKRRVWPALLALPLAALVGFIVAWPAVWVRPLDTVRGLWEYWRWVGISGRAGWTLYPVLAIAFTTPLSTLLLACWGTVGSIRLWRHDGQRSLLLLWLWIVLPVVRASMPGMNVYDGIRHFMEVVPAVAILAALGGGEIAWFVKQAVRAPRWLAHVVAVLFVFPAFLCVVCFAPYEIAFFNRLIGGLPGAQAAGVKDATDYWGTSYRQGFEWVNDAAPDGAALYLPEGQRHLAEAVHGLWIRQDVELISVDEPQLASESIYVMYTTRSTEYGVVERYCQENLDPVYVIEVDGAPILKVFRLSPQVWKSARGWEGLPE
jgi:4-amino-4-deoxy-L-arabinose transferase-like glycosyltransferase